MIKTIYITRPMSYWEALGERQVHIDSLEQKRQEIDRELNELANRNCRIISISDASIPAVSHGEIASLQSGRIGYFVAYEIG
jgi:hypothetical protein